MSAGHLAPPKTLASLWFQAVIGFRNLSVPAVDAETRTLAETQLAQLASELGPTQLRQAADRLAYLPNQDGNAPTDADRARRRYLTQGRQGIDGMSELRGLLDPRSTRHLGCGAGKVGGTRHVQPRRRIAVCR